MRGWKIKNLRGYASLRYLLKSPYPPEMERARGRDWRKAQYLSPRGRVTVRILRSEGGLKSRCRSKFKGEGSAIRVCTGIRKLAKLRIAKFIPLNICFFKR